MNVNVLGVKYEIKQGDKSTFSLLETVDGYTDISVKEIIIQDIEKVDINPDLKKDLKYHINHVIRHEIIHAFLYESGLDACSTNEWAMCEEIIDWIAIQIPKMVKVFKQAECL